MKAKKINILGIWLDMVDLNKAVDIAKDFIISEGAKAIVTPNAEIIMAAQKNEKLREALNAADLSFPDGIGVVIASKYLGTPLSERTAGFDLMMEIIRIAHKMGLSIFLLGGKPGVADEAARNIQRKFPGIKIAGTNHGYFSEDEEKIIIENINKSKPDVLLVAMGAPKQELFIIRYKNVMKTKIAMGVGGSLDVLSGRVKRAPVLLQKAGLEWFYRLVTQPSRIRRMGALPMFIFKVILSKGKGRNAL